MATEKPTLPAPEEQVSPVAEDVQATPPVTEVTEPETPAAADECPVQAAADASEAAAAGSADAEPAAEPAAAAAAQPATAEAAGDPACASAGENGVSAGTEDGPAETPVPVAEENSAAEASAQPAEKPEARPVEKPEAQSVEEADARPAAAEADTEAGTRPEEAEVDTAAGTRPEETEALNGPVAAAEAEAQRAAPAPETATATATEPERPRRARVQGAVAVAAADDEPHSAVPVDFSDEEAALAARNAGLEIGEETSEEADGQPEAATEDRFAGKSKEELVALFAQMLSTQPVQSLRRDVEALKIAFYRLRRAEIEAVRHAFVEEGGAEQDFLPPVDGAEVQFKELFKEYRRLRDEFIANLEAEKERNLQIKLSIIEELKELVNSDETLNHTFNKFRELQQRWKETGIVPQQNVKDLWETYNLHVENFYSFIKINKELRDLDLKKNYEQKVLLCEQAEALVLEPSVVEAFHKLQKLHDQWRETGPVANEFKETLWERFKAASSRINRQHQEHFEALKEEQLRNLTLKTELCADAEELCAQPMTTRKEWNRASDRLLEIQKTWKTIGFAPRKDNNRIYERFRTACDRFFEAKRGFYAGVKGEMEHNLQLKTEICEAAESLSGSEEWKKTTDELIALQARWKEIGAVSNRHSNAIWKRFRTACDKFFARKAAHFSGVDSEHEANLQRKLALLDEMEAADVRSGGYEVIRDFQRRWGEIGFVPIKQKDAVQKRYKAAVDALFDTLRGSERDRSMNRFRDKVSTLRAAGGNRLRSERERLYNKVRQMEQEIALLENNIGFFAKSKNAEALVADVKAKIDRAREEMAAAVEKVKLLDRQAREQQESENNDNK